MMSTGLGLVCVCTFIDGCLIMNDHPFYENYICAFGLTTVFWIHSIIVVVGETPFFLSFFFISSGLFPQR